MKNRNTRRGFTQSCHAELVSASRPLVTIQNKEEILKKFQDDNIIITTHAFTLIELLVVVLIIGILAAVAVPQYQKAIIKSRFIKLYNLAMTYDRIIQEYQLANGTYPDSFDGLAIDKPAGTTKKNISAYSCVKNNEFYCCLIPQIPGSYTQAINCGDSNYTIAFHYMNGSKQPYCVAKTTDKIATKLCKSYGPGTDGWNLFTPDGDKTGYMYYKMD